MASSTISLSLSLSLSLSSRDRHFLAISSSSSSSLALLPHRKQPRSLLPLLSSSPIRFQATATALPLETTPQEIVSAAGDDGASTVIQLLLVVAFIGLSILTIGVVYIAVSDLLQKRERDKLDKEEEAAAPNIKTKKKSKPPKARGFGQKKIDHQFDDT